MDEDAVLRLRQEMLEVQLKTRGIKDPRVLQAMGTVPREQFVPADLREIAYDDGPLPIGKGQTISQPYIVALMAQAADLLPEHHVLEVGTGSGYCAAVLSRISKKIYSIERLAPLSERASKIITNLSYDNVELGVGDGSLGWEEKGPFHAILVTAGAPKVPEKLLDQLMPGGTLVIPVGTGNTQHLLQIKKDAAGQIHEKLVEYVRFVPLLGEAAWRLH